jgi:hypothetical protein
MSRAGSRAGQDVQVERANRRTRCPAWTGAAPFSVIASPLSVAQDAAHIRWVQATGSDEEANSLNLCVLHHKLFDLGAFTLAKDGRVLVSEQAHGTGGFEAALMRHHGKDAPRPQARIRVGPFAPLA